MKVFITLTKKKLCLIFAVTVIAIIITGQAMSLDLNKIDGSTNALRAAYIKSLDLSVDDSDVTFKKTLIPESFNDIYKKYNSIQRQAGFDLSQYKGKSVEVYTYSLFSPADYKVHLIVCDNVIIGGDVASVKLEGEMLPLNFMK